MCAEYNTISDLQLKAADYSKHAGKGMEGAPPPPTPFLKILHPMMIEKVDKNSPLKKAESGSIFNSATETVYRIPWFVPAFYMRRFNEFAGDGRKDMEYRGTYQSMPHGCRFIDGQGHFTLDGTWIKESRMFYGHVLPESGDPQQVCLSLSSTSLKVSTQIFRRLRRSIELNRDGSRFDPPIYSQAFYLRADKKEKGENLWWAWAIEDAVQYVGTGTHLWNKSVEFSEFIRDNLYIPFKSAGDALPPPSDDDIPF